MEIERVRQFNRYYARVLGVFNDRYLGGNHSPAEVRILGEIGRNPGTTAQEILDYMAMDKSNFSKLIRRLEAQGLVQRRRLARDARRIALELTPEGMAVNGELDRRADARIAAQLQGMDAAQKTELMAAMDKIRRIMSCAVADIEPNMIEKSEGIGMYGLRVAEISELPRAMDLIDQAKRYLKEQGVDQWQKGYPDEACLRGDLAGRKGYFMVDENGGIAAYMCVDFDGEPAYDGLKGEWKTGESRDYAVVHRLAVDGSRRGKGLAGRAFALVEQLCADRQVLSIRVDTDADNRIMRRVMDRNGFEYCGVIRFDNSDKIAFEKIIGEQA